MNRDTRRSRVVLAVLLLLSFTLITLDFRGGGTSDVLRRAGGTLLGPLESAAGTVVRPVSRFFDDLAAFRTDRAQVSRLERENAALRLQVRENAVNRSVLAQYQRIMRMAGLGQYSVVPARVVAVGTAQGFSETVTIDAGTSDGVREDMTVMSSDGLVGRVKATSPTTSTVVLVVDPGVTAFVQVTGSGELGYVTGRGAQPLLLELVNPQAKLRVGDQVVTKGSPGNRPWVPGVPVGTVASIALRPGTLTKVAAVRPYARMSALDLVAVVTEGPRSQPRAPLRPPAPASAR